MITIENKNNVVYLFGRHKDGTSYIKMDSSFTPYFYAESPLGIYNTIDGKRAKRIEVASPFDIQREREKYNVTYESDINFVNKYLIDKVETIEKEPIRICYIDLEVKRTENGYEGPEEANNPILMIGCYDNFDNERTRFVIGKTHDNEKDMLLAFIKYVQQKDPDMFIAWNGDMFDFPFLIRRINKLRLDSRMLARAHGDAHTYQVGQKGNIYNTRIFGRVTLDLLQMYKKFTSNAGRESWSLDYISKYELKEKGGKDKYKGELDDLYTEDIDTFIKYNDRDVDLLVLLDNQLRLTDFFDEVRRLSFCQFNDVFMNGRIADGLCLKYAKNKFVLPKSNFQDGEKFIGAFVKESEPKLLYPSIMVGCNTSYETIIPFKTDNCINIDDRYYFKKETGIIPAIVRPILMERENTKGEMKKFKKGTPEYFALDMKQYALKVIANSFYGVMGSPHYRLYKRDVAQCITYTAQKVIKETIKWFEDRGHRAIYSDTDSCFILMNEKNVEQMQQMNKEVNNYIKDMMLKIGVEERNYIFELQFEKVFKTVFFKKGREEGKGSKKKYAGRMIWKGGDDVDELSITGFESKRSDNPTAGRQLIKDILKMIVYEYPKEEVDAHVKVFKDKIKNKEVSIEDLSFPVGISKPLEDYGNTIHVRAAKNANERHNAQIKQGDKIKYVFVKECGVIAFKEYMWDGYTIDYDKITRRIIDMKIGPLYESLGWNYEYPVTIKEEKGKIISNEPKLEDIYKQKPLWM
jgi:DNA polymerase, archaea type